MIHKLILFGAECNGVIRLGSRGALGKWISTPIKSIHEGIWAIRFEIRIVLNARGHTGLGVAVFSCTTIWVIVRVEREACSAGTIAPARESRRLERFLEWSGTLCAKVNTALGDFAVCIIVNAHRQVEAIHEQNCQKDISKTQIGAMQAIDDRLSY